MTGETEFGGIAARYHRLRQIRPQWLWLIVVAVVLYGLLVALMVLSASGSATTSQALADTPAAAAEAVPVALRPSSAPAARPRETGAADTGSGVVFYTPAQPDGSVTGTGSGSGTGTGTTTTPATDGTALVAAEQAVERADQTLAALRAGGTATAAELAVARYELARARQNLADLTAGTPGRAHHELDVLEATVYRNLAVERCRAAMADPSVTDAEQKYAYALVRQWQARLDDLLGR